MNDSEKSVYVYLTSLGLGTVVFEPDGKVPPDFSVDGRTAVEVRRLNQNEDTAGGQVGTKKWNQPGCPTAVVAQAVEKLGEPSGIRTLDPLIKSQETPDRKSTRLNSSHRCISY